MKKWLVLSGTLLLLGMAGTAQTTDDSARTDENVETGAGANLRYFSLKIGVSTPKNSKLTTDDGSGGTIDLNSGLSFSAAVGLRLQQSFRLELEASARRSSITKLTDFNGDAAGGRLETKTLLGNVYYDFPVMNGIQPYLGMGIGLARHDLNPASASPLLPGRAGGLEQAGFDGSDQHVNTLIGQVGLGMLYLFSDTLAADLGYRYLKGGDIRLIGPVDTASNYSSNASLKFDSHEFTAGMRFGF
ncbi:MAG: outer membrane beta-barrel protein [Magnetococcus sp. DMHC-8]